MNVAGIILAGGLSRRMGGGDKTLLPLAGTTLLDHVIGRLRPQAGLVAINANGDPGRFEKFGLPVVPDTVPGNAGPLAGVLSGMEWAMRFDKTALATVAGDTPFFPADLVARLAMAWSGGPDRIAVARSAGRLHPVFACWPTHLRDDLEAFLRDGTTFRVTDFIDRAGYTAVDFAFTDGADPFFNINTAADLAAAEARIARGGR